MNSTGEHNETMDPRRRRFRPFRSRVVASAGDGATHHTGGQPCTRRRPGGTRQTRCTSNRRAVRPTAPELITFDEYRDFRMHDIAQRQARLARELAAPDLSAAQKADLERRKAYYDRLAAMPADQRNQLFRARFDQIDTNHDGMLDSAERAAWRDKQRAHYRELAAARSAADPDQH